MKCNSQSVVQNCYFLFQGTWSPYCRVVEGYQLCVLLPTRHNVITRLIVVVAAAAAFHCSLILIFIFLSTLTDTKINLEIEVLFSGANR